MTKDETNSAEIFASGEEAQMVDFYRQNANDYQPAAQAEVIDVSGLDPYGSSEDEEALIQRFAEANGFDPELVTLYNEEQSAFHDGYKFGVQAPNEVSEYEYVYSWEDGTLATDGAQGTINAANPALPYIGTIGHGILDVGLWVPSDTGAGDDSTMGDRTNDRFLHSI